MTVGIAVESAVVVVDKRIAVEPIVAAGESASVVPGLVPIVAGDCTVPPSTLSIPKAAAGGRCGGSWVS